MSDLVPVGKNNILIEQESRLAEAWIKELQAQGLMDVEDPEALKRNARQFLSSFLTSIATHAAPSLTKEHLVFFRNISAQLKSQCLGENCTPQAQAAYLMTLKTAFIRFLQEYYQGRKFEMHQEFQDFSNIIDLLGFFIIQSYAEVKEEELRQLKKPKQYELLSSRIIGNSKVMHDLFEKVQAVLDSDVTVLIEGETGTGKELLAQAIHYQGPRKDKPFVAINCAAIPESLLESELFGYEKGAFTGADKAKKGKLELANGGTFFLDEIGDLSLDLQAKLLRVLQNKQVIPLGGYHPVDIDVRIIAATNKNLLKEVEEKRFREDLYYRLAVFPLRLPPLRERGEDLLLLAEYFLNEENKKGKKKIKGFSREAIKALFEHNWPGNIRELENVIKRAYVLCDKEEIMPEHLMFVNLRPALMAPQEQPTYLPLAEIEKQAIEARLQAFGGNISKAAKSLGITRATLYKKLGSVKK